MFVPCPKEYLRLTERLFESGACRFPVPASYRAWQLPDQLKADITVGRAEVVLASARAQMALKYRTLPMTRVWMRNEFFLTPDTSIASVLCGDCELPALDTRYPELRAFFEELASMNGVERFALGDLLEEAWYRWIPSGSSLPDVFAAYGLPFDCKSD